jgi:cell division protein FtsA
MMDNQIPQHSDEIVVGLDIGTTKIACFIGRKNEFGKIELLGYGRSESVGVSRGVVANIDRTVESIKQAVQEAEEKVGAQIGLVNVGIAGQHIKSLQHRGLITRENLEAEISQLDIEALIDDMHKLVMQPGEEILHVIPQEFTVDNEQGIKDPIGMAGVRLEANFHIITGQIAAAQNIYKCIRKAGLEVDQLILEPLASAASVLSEEEKEAGVALVDIGGGTTDIAIFQDGIIRHTAVIPFGGNVISDDIRQGCQIMKRQAEQLKKKFGSALSKETKANEIVCIPGLTGKKPKEIALKTLAQIIEARMTEIIEHVHYEIRSSGYGDQLIGGIVLTGGGSQLKHVTQLFQFVTGLDCRLGFPGEHIAKAPEDTSIPSYSTGVGLVIKGYDTLRTQRTADASGDAPQLKIQPRDIGIDKFFKSIKNWFETEDMS